MNKVIRFFWFCSGVHMPTLEKHPTEHNKYVGIGATIFFTGLFAALSGGYAMYFVFAGNPAAILFSLIFGILWGLAIFNMDRYIVGSINKNASTWKQGAQATPRILLAIMIGIVISRPLELKIFDKEDKIGQWMMFLYNPEQKEVVQIMDINEDIRKAAEELDAMSEDDELRAMAELRLKGLRDEQAALEYATNKGIEEGIEQGEKRKQKEIAKNILKENISIEIIKKVTGLTEEEVKEIEKL